MIESNIRKDIENKIDLYIEGKLTPREIDELWAELIQDEYYFEYLKTVASLHGLARKKNQEKAKIFSFASGKQWYAAAAVLLLVGTLAVFNIFNENQYPVEPIASIELDYYRSSEGTVTDTDTTDLVIRSITMANSGEIETAVLMIDQGLDEAEGDQKMELLVTAGSIHYNANNFTQAADRFESALAIPTNNISLQERAYWYLGNTYFQLNKIAEAKEVLEKAYELNGAYSRVAQSYLRALSD
ncbi:MAG: tetratricopeptide repeat protein [Balneolaceae bacterium]